MAAEPMPDQVDCAQLADTEAVLERTYELADLGRLRDLLAETQGSLHARFAFVKLSGRCGAVVTVSATPQLLCQRCLQGFGYSAAGSSEIEFVTGDRQDGAASEREPVEMQNGRVSLRELAEEELLLALPHAAMCSTPLTCGKAPLYATDEARAAAEDRRRPFSALQDLLRKT